MNSTRDQLALKESTIEELKSKLECHEFAEDSEQTMTPESLTSTNYRHNSSPPLLNNEGFVLPKKPTNPVRENPERQNLHRELLFNQKMGKNVLNQKSELQKALERQKDNLARKNLEDKMASNTPELEKVIASRARKMQNPDKDKDEDDKVINKELLEIRMKLKKSNNYV